MDSIVSVIALIATALVLLLALIGLAAVLLRAGRFTVRTGSSLVRVLNGPGTPPPPRRPRTNTAAPSPEPPATNDAANGPAA